MGNWDIEKFLLTVKTIELINEPLPSKINPAKDGIFDIPVFHHSLAQTWFAWTQFYTFGPRNITVAT